MNCFRKTGFSCGDVCEDESTPGSFHDVIHRLSSYVYIPTELTCDMVVDIDENIEISGVLTDGEKMKCCLLSDECDSEDKTNFESITGYDALLAVEQLKGFATSIKSKSSDLYSIFNSLLLELKTIIEENA